MLLGTGKVSSFGGPLDAGVGDQEGLSCIDLIDLSDWWFDRLFFASSEWNQDDGLARNLNPKALYIAMRWAYGSFEGTPGEILPGLSREEVRRGIFRLSANGQSCFVQAADWGPNLDTGRFVDCSPAILPILGLATDDKVTVEFFPAVEGSI